MLFSIVVPPIYIPINSVRAIHYFRYIGLEKYIIKMNFTGSGVSSRRRRRSRRSRDA